LAVLTISVVALATVYNALAGRHGESWWAWAAFTACTLSSAVLGVLIEFRRPGHRIGHLLQANGVVLAIMALAGAFAAYAVLEHPGTAGGHWAVLVEGAGWPLLYVPVMAIAFVFPDGRIMPSRRWRTLARVGVGSFALLLVVSAFADRPFDAPFASVDRPLPAIPSAIGGPLLAVGLLGAVLTLVAGALALRTRWFRAAGAERLQLRWLAYASCLIPVTIIVCLAEALITNGDRVALEVSLVVMLAAIPVAVAVPILRHGLYEIDELVDRTLIYLTLSALLLGVYAVLTVALATAAGGRSSWTTAAATLAVALAFRPLRGQVQDLVDRRFHRARYDGVRRVNAFLADLRSGNAQPEGIEQVLAAALGDPSLEVHYWLPQADAYVDPAGREPRVDAGDRAELPVQRAGVPLARIVHDPVLDAQPELRANVVEAAGLAIEIARLRVELRRQLDEVSASRARIVAAGDAERRRIERDLHDGAQQRLVSIGLALRHVQHELSPNGNGTSSALDDVVGELGTAVAELRGLARGVRPPQLDEGLAPALRELAGRAGLPVEVEATAQRFSPGIEAAAYFVACEGLTNATRHAGATTVTLRSAHEADRLVLTISDDGVGGASANGGTGITGLADRVHAHGGTLSVNSPLDQGTVLTAEFPCDS